MKIFQVIIKTNYYLIITNIGYQDYQNVVTVLPKRGNDLTKAW